MWAQLQKVSLKPDSETALLAVFDQLQAIEPQDSGLLRTLVMRSRSDPSVGFVLVLFEDEEKARAREQDPARQEALVGIRASIGEVMQAPPEFFDLDVLLDR